MALSLRQIALVAARLAPVEADLLDIFAVRACHRDPAVAAYGLENVLLPFGQQFLEVVAPTRAGTAAERYLDRRQGDGGYMLITQCEDHEEQRRHVEALGIRIAHEFKADGFRNMQLDPRDTGGTFLEIDQQLDDAANWLPAGPDWRAQVCMERVDAIVAAEIQADDPPALAAHWARIVQQPVSDERGLPALHLANARLRFAPCSDGRPAGLAGLDVRATDKAAVLRAAARRGVAVADDGFTLAGMRWRLV